MANKKKIELTQQFALLRPGVYEIIDSVHYAGIEVYEVGYVRLLLLVGYADWESAVQRGIVVDAPIDSSIDLGNYNVLVGPDGIVMTVPTELGVPLVIEQKRVA